LPKQQARLKLWLAFNQHVKKSACTEDCGQYLSVEVMVHEILQRTHQRTSGTSPEVRCQLRGTRALPARCES